MRNLIIVPGRDADSISPRTLTGEVGDVQLSHTKTHSELWRQRSSQHAINPLQHNCLQKHYNHLTDCWGLHSICFLSRYQMNGYSLFIGPYNSPVHPRRTCIPSSSRSLSQHRFSLPVTDVEVETKKGMERTSQESEARRHNLDN